MEFKDIKTKNDFMQFANKGVFEYNGIKIEIVERESAGNNGQWVEIFCGQLTKYHEPLVLGNKWTEFITDEECAKLPNAIDEYKRKSDEYAADVEKYVTEYKTVEKTHGRNKLQIISTNAAFEVNTDCKKKHYAAQQYLTSKDGYSSQFFLGDGYTAIIDGKKYLPKWSYWNERAVYELPEDAEA